MEKEFVPYKEALALKKLGFDEPCFSVYYDTKEFKSYTGEWLEYNSKFNNKGIISAPLFQQAFRWFREKFIIYVLPKVTLDSNGDWFYCEIYNKQKSKLTYTEGSFNFEESQLTCLKELIKISKKK
jgi:hypothetical protein